MKTGYFRLLLLTVILIISLPVSITGQDDQRDDNRTKKIRLFNKKDLKNWVFVLEDQDTDPKTVFTIQKKKIHIAGDPFGYMRTSETYSDYSLHVEWRWPEQPTNSGIFIHTQKPDTIWPECIECQLKAGSAGDFVCMSGADIAERTDKSSIVVIKSNPSSEKSAGKWNKMDVICKSDTIEVYVNGILQNRGTGLSVIRGHISLQSEGEDIEFRKVYLKHLN